MHAKRRNRTSSLEVLNFHSLILIAVGFSFGFILFLCQQTKYTMHF